MTYDGEVRDNPWRSWAILSLSVGGGCVAFAFALGHPAPLVLAVPFLGYGGMLAYLGPRVIATNLVAAAINRGELDDARARISALRAKGTIAAYARTLDAHEAEICWREGDLEGVRRNAEQGLRRRGLLSDAALFDPHLAAQRAVACAAQGDEAEAERSIARVRSTPRAAPAALARAGLAEAMIAARRGDLESLHRRLAEHHVLLTESLDPRGRALHRALRRMVAVRSSAAYRVPVKQEAARVGARAWMARVFPQAEDCVEVLDEPAPLPQLDPRPPGPLPTVAARRSLGVRVVATWLALVAIFAVLYQLLDRFEPPELRVAHYLVIFVLFAAVFLAINVRRARAGRATLEEAGRALAMGEHARAEALARSLRESTNLWLAASAALLLSQVLERRADLVGALAECDRGLGFASGTVADGVLLGHLVATRARLYGALGRESESDAELTRLTEKYPAFPYAAGAVLGTRLLRAIRRGDREEATQLARARGEVLVGASIELLAELTLAEAGEDRDARIDAVRQDLAQMPDVERWIRAAAPGFLERTLPRRT